MKKLIMAIYVILSVTVLGFSARVVKVYDGDTITVVNTENNKKIKVRLYGVDAPEISQEYGRNSRDWVRNRIKGQIVGINEINKDKYGRVVAKVYYNEGDYLNRDLIESGGAWWYEYYAKDDRLLEVAEENAKESNRGLWAGNPINPHEFRKTKKHSSIKDIDKDAIVYVTRTGKKYHKDGCIYLKYKYLEYKVSEAEALGYTPCSRYNK